MKEYLIELTAKYKDSQSAKNTCREYLQDRILSSLQRSGAMIPLAFHGGTALRFLYKHGRYSEDLDFALEGNRSLYNFRDYLHAIQKDLALEGYSIDIKVKESTTVHSAQVRFPGLLYELQISPQASEVFAIKIEVDTNPPAGAGLQTSIVRKYSVLQLQHHDPPSLLAGKLHAVLQRPFIKGRDIYDLFWYLSDPAWPQPNLVMLHNALQQTGWLGEEPSENNWRSLVRQRLLEANWETIRNDVIPFIDQNFDVQLLSFDNLNRLLNARR